ncbi:hypothetical protein GYMLUDRAFT_35411 [Collybiopsis luxurians FD-317 M1]|nr:hypothetical protein GYMLUDRAFT_35411 [Collybiopsis luxurians FD-317 M1]
MATWSYPILPVLFHYQSYPMSSSPPLSEKSETQNTQTENTSGSTTPLGSSQSDKTKDWAAEYFSKSLTTQQALQRKSDKETRRSRDQYENGRWRNNARFDPNPGI